MTEPLLELDRLTVNYGARRAVDDVSFRVGRGVTGLLGPNGAGKSSLLRAAATAQPANGGSVRVAGLDAGDPAQRRHLRRRLGYLPQTPGFYPGFTVRAFTDHIAVLKEISPGPLRRTEVDRVLAAVRLDDRRSDKVRSLSGGMRQRLALACAMLGAPPVVILDEPTVGLDPEQRLRFREVIAELGQSSAVLLSTHQTDDVASLCSRVIVLNNGRVRMDGTTKELTDCAGGRVWESDRREPAALAAWATGEGLYRSIGSPPPDAVRLDPTLDDGYLILMHEAAGSVGSGVTP